MKIASGIQECTDRNGGKEKKRMFERYYIHQFGGALIFQRQDKDVSIVLKKKPYKEETTTNKHK